MIQYNDRVLMADELRGQSGREGMKPTRASLSQP
jgi:hypothetical protein